MEDPSSQEERIDSSILILVRFQEERVSELALISSSDRSGRTRAGETDHLVFIFRET